MRTRTIRQLVVPSFLCVSVLLGGSSRAIWGPLTLQLFALALIGWMLTKPGAAAAPRAFWLLVGAFLALMALQLVPLPPELWTRLPGRQVLVSGYADLRQAPPWLPISMAPVNTLSAALALLPPIAMLTAITPRDQSDAWTAIAFLGATLTSISLGFVQVSTRSENWYLYEFTNLGSSVGFFANRNHMGTLLLAAIPFIALLLSNDTALGRSASAATRVFASASGVFVLIGIAMNGSLAAVLLGVPVVTASALLFRWPQRMRMVVVIISAIASIAALIVLASSPVQAKLTGAQTSSITGRWEIWTVTWSAIQATFPVGTGFGSFEQVYHLFENPLSVTGTFVNHAHNDYLEVILEGGAPGALLLICFLLWWALAARAAWRTNRATLAKAATIASAAILGHSIVDYPLRTDAIAVVFAFCLSLMGTNAGSLMRRGQRSESASERPRHVTIR